MGIAAGVAAGLARRPATSKRCRLTELRPPRRPTTSPAGSRLLPSLTPLRFTHRVEPRAAVGAGRRLRASCSTSRGSVGVWRRRGDRWPWYRTALWIAGMLALLWVTNGARERLRAVPVQRAHARPHAADDGDPGHARARRRPSRSRCGRSANARTAAAGPREWILLRGALASRRPCSPTRSSAAVLFAASLWLFYYTPHASAGRTEDHVGHIWMVVALPHHRVPVRARCWSASTR